MRQNYDMILQFLEEGLVALLPDNGDSDGDKDCVCSTQVFTLQGVHGERRSLTWLVELLVRYYRLDLAAVRRHTGRQLGLSHHIPLPLAEGLVLLPVKVRRATELGEHTTGFVNLMQVERVEAVGPVGKRGGAGETLCVEDGNKEDRGVAETGMVQSEYDASAPTGSAEHKNYAATAPELIRCRIICRGGLVIYCLNRAATVRAKLHQGEAARQDLLQRQKATALPAAPFRGLNGAALQKMLPSCECLLKSAFLLLLERASRIGSGRKE